MCSRLIGRFGAIRGRMVCTLAVALLACASVAYGQVIEEGGFPVKGGGASGESFSLSCPSRLVVQAGSSIVLSCSAAAVLEEGIRYEWESLSGDGLHLLSSAHELSPLFTASLSGAGEDYAYRLTASAENAEDGTAEVTVTVLNKGALALVCTDTYEVYEGSADFDLDCSASGAPSGSDYMYVWTARGGTANTDLLIAGTDGRELGRRETLVYTRSRVRIPLDRMPEEGAVFLRFSPRGSDRVPEPASVEWDAPRRNIGAAEDKDRTRIPETLVQRP